ncbi:electron transfer flavoprotein subunit beta/FixA family protein [Desulfospira joergensenii]|uniref:electron transfer flavoprotein subunit beta/FixA family protein n=1 Tax=Desulfospira joergensenii TaxID=53329 RepID=UPI0003B637D8|nr:electron transfer flavoprotein subunit beta/FixA family protein [Desulfospira joergensenii]
MQIYVCIKHVPDSAANISIRDRVSIDENVAFLINPYDEHGISEAVRLKEQFPGSEIIALCLGKKDAEKTIRSAMAMGADRGILVETDAVPDAMITARVLKAAMEEDGQPGIIFTGKESIDREGMQTMFRLGALFDFPVANNVVGLEIQENRARVTYEMGGGQTRVCDMSMPCVIGAGRGLNTPGYPTFPDVVKARKKPVKFIDMDSLAVEPSKGSLRVKELEPFVQDRTPKEIKGSPSEIAQTIFTILKEEAKVI